MTIKTKTAAAELHTTLAKLETSWLDWLGKRNASTYGSPEYRKAIFFSDKVEDKASLLAFGDTNHTLLQSVRKAKLLVAAERLLQPTSGTDDCIRFLNEEETYEWEVNETAPEDIDYTDTPVERATALLENFRKLA